MLKMLDWIRFVVVYGVIWARIARLNFKCQFGFILWSYMG